VAVALVGAACAVPWLVDHRIDWVASAPLLAALGGAGAAVTLGWRGRTLGATIAAIATASILFATILGTVLPRAQGLWLSARAAEMMLAYRPSAASPVAAAGYAEPSLVFLLGTATALTGGGGAADFLAAHDDGLALVATEQDAAFRTQAAARGLAVQELDRRAGYNYSRGRWTSLALYRRTRS
jgi:hypothetical protein